MEVLILGGTGVMGSYLVNLLIDNKDSVYVTSRRDMNSKFENLTYILGDAHDELFLDSVLSKRWDVIVDFMYYSTPEFKFRSEKLLKNTKQYIYISSARVYAEYDGLIEETSPRLIDIIKDEKFLNSNEYSLKKARQEDILSNSKFKNWTIIRPYITYGDERLQLHTLEKEDWLFRALNNKSSTLSQEVNQKVTTLTHGYDVARGIFSLLGRTEAFGEAFHITHNDTILWSDVLEVYHDVLKEHNYDLKVKVKPLNHFYHWHRFRYQILNDRLYDRKFNNRKIEQFIDTSTFINPRDGLRNSLVLFLEERDFKNINLKNEAAEDGLFNVYNSLINIDSKKIKLKYALFFISYKCRNLIGFIHSKFSNFKKYL